MIKESKDRVEDKESEVAKQYVKLRAHEYEKECRIVTTFLEVYTIRVHFRKVKKLFVDFITWDHFKLSNLVESFGNKHRICWKFNAFYKR